MAAAPVAGGNDNDADGKARNVVVKSETMDVEYGEDGVPQPAAPAFGDPVLAFGSFDDKVADDLQFAEDEHRDSTECSSSFGDSLFASDDDAESDAGVMEVDSPFYSHINVDDTTAVPHAVRKKKVAAEWRKFIGPERWRCQWLELRMKDLLSQVAKYDKELALINHEKDLQLEMIKADSCKSELPQLDLPSHERNTMKRRKRKRHEDNADTLLYIRKHQIFSYYSHENKKSRAENEKSGAEKTGTDELLAIDGFNSSDVEDTKSSLGPNDTLLKSKKNDTVLQQYSLREILLAIECIQSRIINLQSHLSEAHKKIGHTQKSQKKKDSHSLHKKKDVSRPFGADEDEITVEMLFGVNNPLIDAHMGGICKENVDDVLIDNQAAIEEEFWQFERVKKTDETHSELVKNVAEAPIVKPLI